MNKEQIGNMVKAIRMLDSARMEIDGFRRKVQKEYRGGEDGFLRDAALSHLRVTWGLSNSQAEELLQAWIDVEV